MPLKFGDPASIAQKEQARISAARERARKDFPTNSINLLIEWLEELPVERTRAGMAAIIRGWLDKCYEERED